MRQVYRIALAACLPAAALFCVVATPSFSIAQENRIEVDVDAKYPAEAKALYLSRLKEMFGGGSGLQYDPLRDGTRGSQFDAFATCRQK